MMVSGQSDFLHGSWLIPELKFQEASVAAMYKASYDLGLEVSDHPFDAILLVKQVPKQRTIPI